VNFILEEDRATGVDDTTVGDNTEGTGILGDVEIMDDS
jgi:hypothetical protein